MPFTVLPSQVISIRGGRPGKAIPEARILQVKQERLIDIGERIWTAFQARYHRSKIAAGPSDHFFHAYYNTERLIKNPNIRAILGPAFYWRDVEQEGPLDAGIGVRAGSLVRLDNGTFELVDLKAVKNVFTTSQNVNAKGDVTKRRNLKMDYVHDLAVRVFVARAAGIPVSQAGIMHLSGEDVFSKRVHDPATLLRYVDLTEPVERLQEEIPARIRNGNVKKGNVKKENAKSPRSKQRSTDKGSPTAVSSLYRFKDGLRQELRERGIKYIRDIPDDFHEEGHLSPIQGRQVAASKQDEVIVEDREGLQEKLKKILAMANEPGSRISFFDVETIAPVLALLHGTNNGEMLTVQFSNHFIEADGTIQHKEFLFDGDPNHHKAGKHLDVNLAKAILKAVGKKGPILVWSSSFEKGRIRELAARLRKRKVHDLAVRLDTLTSDGALRALIQELRNKGEKSWARQLGKAIGSDTLLRQYVDYLRKPQKKGRKKLDPSKKALALADRIEAMMADERIVDMLPITRDHVFHPKLDSSMESLFSIKNVLQAFCEGRGYGDLDEIQNGDAVTWALQEIYDPNTTEKRREEIIQKALIYCMRDTEAEVWILKELFKYAGLEWPFETLP